MSKPLRQRIVMELRYWRPKRHNCGVHRWFGVGPFVLVDERRPHRTIGWQFWIGEHMWVVGK